MSSAATARTCAAAGDVGGRRRVAGGSAPAADRRVRRPLRHGPARRLGLPDRPAGQIVRAGRDGAPQPLRPGLQRPEGELFTYDSDMEWDAGTPWYRPTRVNHVIDGADFGWRAGTSKWPDDYLDSFGSVVDVGFGSPTGRHVRDRGQVPAEVPAGPVRRRLELRQHLRRPPGAAGRVVHGDGRAVRERGPAARHGPVRPPAGRGAVLHRRRPGHHVGPVPGDLCRGGGRRAGRRPGRPRGRTPSPEAPARGGRVARPRLVEPRAPGPGGPPRRPPGGRASAGRSAGAAGRWPRATRVPGSPRWSRWPGGTSGRPGPRSSRPWAGSTGPALADGDRLDLLRAYELAAARSAPADRATRERIVRQLDPWFPSHRSGSTASWRRS